MTPNQNATAENTPVASSTFTYEPPAGPEPEETQSFEQSLKDVVSEIEDEFAQSKYEFNEEELAEGEPKPEAPEPEVEPEAVAEDDEAPEVKRGLDRLVAREVALQAKEAEFQGRFAKVAALEAEVSKLRQAIPSRQVVEGLDISPTETLKSLGKDPEAVVRMMIAEQLEARGQEVPAELKEFVKEARREQRVRSLEAQILQRNQVDQAQAELNAVKLGALEYVKTIVGHREQATAPKEAQAALKALPTLTEIAKDNAEYVQLEIMEEIQRDAREKLSQGADPSSQALTFFEAAKLVEARFAKTKAMFTPKSPAGTPTKPVEGKKPIPPTNKPPATPLKPWQKKDDDLYARGIAEAEREFYLLEAKAKRARQ